MQPGEAMQAQALTGFSAQRLAAAHTLQPDTAVLWNLHNMVARLIETSCGWLMVKAADHTMTERA
jgi:6-phosphogluconate dehydrogenase (decarboxylating)